MLIFKVSQIISKLKEAIIEAGFLYQENYLCLTALSLVLENPSLNLDLDLFAME